MTTVFDNPAWMLKVSGADVEGPEGNAYEVVAARVEAKEKFAALPKGVDEGTLRQVGVEKRKALLAFEEGLMPRVIEAAEREAAAVDLPVYDGGFDGLVSLGFAEPNTEAWLLMRAGDEDNVAIGGSDFAVLATKTNSKGFAPDLIRSKVNPLAPSYSVNEYSLPYGNAFEPLIAKHAESLIREALGDSVHVAVTKDTYVSVADSRLRCNVDAVVVDTASNSPVGIVEIKTGWNADRWLNSEGVVTPPVEYVAQLLYYLEQTGVEHGFLVASVCGSEPVMFRYARGQKISDTIGSVNEVLGAFLDDFERTVFDVKGGAPIARARKPKIGMYDIPANLHHALEVTTRPAYIVDLETTGVDAFESIIEVGVVDTRTGVKVVDELYAPASVIAEAYGTGPSHVHQITLDMVEGKPTFEEAGADVLRELFDGALVLAHNAAFEKKFLTPFLTDDVQWVDTMAFARDWCPGSEGKSLRSWVEFEGGVYPEDAHRAVVDCETTFDALTRLFSRLGLNE